MNILIKRDPKVVYKSLRFRSPIGVHAFYLDLVKFAGGISMILPLFVECEIKIQTSEHDNESDFIIRGLEDKDSKTILKFLVEFLDYIGLQVPAEIEVHGRVPDKIRQHMTASLVVSVLSSMNMALNRPLDYRELRLIIMELARKIQSPVSLLLLDGSLATAVMYESLAITVHGEVLIAKRLSNDLRAYMLRLSENKGAPRHLIGDMKEAELQDKHIKNEIVLMELYPALIRFDTKKIKAAFNNLHFIGSKLAEIILSGLYEEIVALKKIFYENDDVILYVVPTFSDVMVIITNNKRIILPLEGLKSTYLGEYGKLSKKDIEVMYINSKKRNGEL